MSLARIDFAAPTAHEFCNEQQLPIMNSFCHV